MSTPSNRTRIRSAINLVSRDMDPANAAIIAISEAINATSRRFVLSAVLQDGREGLPGLLGVDEVHQVADIKKPNVGKNKNLRPYVRLAATPVYIMLEVLAERDRLNALPSRKRAAADRLNAMREKGERS